MSKPSRGRAGALECGAPARDDRSIHHSSRRRFGSVTIRGCLAEREARGVTAVENGLSHVSPYPELHRPCPRTILNVLSARSLRACAAQAENNNTARTVIARRFLVMRAERFAIGVFILRYDRILLHHLFSSRQFQKLPPDEVVKSRRGFTETATGICLHYCPHCVHRTQLRSRRNHRQTARPVPTPGRLPVLQLALRRS